MAELNLFRGIQIKMALFRLFKEMFDNHLSFPSHFTVIYIYVALVNHIKSQQYNSFQLCYNKNM